MTSIVDYSPLLLNRAARVPSSQSAITGATTTNIQVTAQNKFVPLLNIPLPQSLVATPGFAFCSNEPNALAKGLDVTNFEAGPMQRYGADTPSGRC